MIKNCQNCGKQYFVKSGQESRSKFCSDKCFRKSRNTQREYHCDCCGAAFLVRESKIRAREVGKLKTLCCSSECARNIQKPKWDIIRQTFVDKGYELKSTRYISNKSKLEYVCPKHADNGSQFITYNNIKCSYGCKYCGVESTASKRRLTFDNVKKIFENHDMILQDGQEYHNAAEPLAYVCKRHSEYGVQYMSVSNARRNHCPHCSQSKGEARISQYLIANNITFESQYKFDDLIGLGGGRLSYDFYLPSYNILIEYQGEFHDGKTNGFQTEEQLCVQKEHDKRKRTYARTHGYLLLELWHQDIESVEKILAAALVA